MVRYFGVGARGEAYRDLQGRQAAADAVEDNPLLQQLA